MEADLNLVRVLAGQSYLGKENPSRKIASSTKDSQTQEYLALSRIFNKRGGGQCGQSSTGEGKSMDY